MYRRRWRRFTRGFWRSNRVSAEVPVPRWIKVLRVITLAGLPIMLFNCRQAWQDERPEFDELVATTLILAACAHLLLRAPFRRWRGWEWPLTASSVALASAGGFLFTPAEEERILGLQIFIGAFAGLAVTYGFFCTAVPAGHELRGAVIEPTKRFSKIGVVGFDFGLVGAPFAFVFFLIRYFRRKGVSRNAGQ